MGFKEKIRRFRKHKGLTQEGLAHQLGIASSTLRNYETARTGQNFVGFFNKLKEVFPELNLNWLLSVEEEMIQAAHQSDSEEMLHSNGSDNTKEKTNLKEEEVPKEVNPYLQALLSSHNEVLQEKERIIQEKESRIKDLEKQLELLRDLVSNKS